MDLGTVFETAVARDPQAVAFVDGSVRITYADWWDEIRRVAGGLAARGFGRGDRLVAVMANRYELATLFWACQTLACVFTPFNWRATADEIAYVLTDADAKLVAYDEGAEAAVLGAARIAGVPRPALLAAGEAGGDQGATFAALQQSDPVPGPVGAEDDATCLMLYTSGTTGRPKGVPRSNRAERSAATSVIGHLHYRFGERFLGVMPLFHTMGVRILLCSTMLNGTFVGMRAFDPAGVLRVIEAERVSAIFLVSTMYHDMFACPEFATTDCSSIRNVAYAGMLMTGGLERRCAELLRPQVFANYYGSTEIFTFTFCDYLDRKPGCAGRAGMNQAIRVVRADPDGKARPDDIVAVGEVGEVIGSMRSPEAFTGYWNRPDADAKAIRDGWYFTGDLGYLDEDGALFLCGRIDDMIISGGENIHPEEVEDTLAECPLVRQAAVVGLPDERWGQKVVAFIEPSCPDACADALDAHCRTSALARFKRPRAYVFVERIPRSASGKLLRRFLRDGAYQVLPGFTHTL